MRVIKLLLAIGLILCFQACSSQGYKANKDYRLPKSANNDNDTSILITKVDTKSVDYSGKVFDRNFTEMDWCRTENKRRCKDVLYFNPYTKIKFINDDYYSFYSIKPGFYYLDEIKQFTGYLEEWYLLPIIIPIGILSLGSAGVRPTGNFETSISGWNTKHEAPNRISKIRDYQARY